MGSLSANAMVVAGLDIPAKAVLGSKGERVQFYTLFGSSLVGLQLQSQEDSMIAESIVEIRLATPPKEDWRITLRFPMPSDFKQLEEALGDSVQWNLGIVTPPSRFPSWEKEYREYYSRHHPYDGGIGVQQESGADWAASMMR